MPVSFDVRGDTKAILKDMRFVSNDLALRAQIFAINRAAQATETRVRKETAAQAGILQKHVRPKMRRSRATFTRRKAVQRFYSGGIKAIDAGKEAKGKQFKATMWTGHTGIFRFKDEPPRLAKRGPRVGTGVKIRPIAEVAVALIPQLLKNEEAHLRRFTPGEYRRVFARDLNRRIKRIRIFR